MSTFRLLSNPLLARTSSRTFLPNFHKAFIKKSTSTVLNCLPSCCNLLRHFSVSFKRHHDDRETKTKGHLKLMSFPHMPLALPPGVIKFLKNMYFAFLIRTYYDEFFSTSEFLKGAEHALLHVSRYISFGDFDSLKGLVDSKALDEIKINYNVLTEEQREIIQVDAIDLFFKTIYQIGIFGGDAGRLFVEVTTVFLGAPGVRNIESVQEMTRSSWMKQKLSNTYGCNYRFIKEITKGVESDWTINKLNHFLIRELKPT